MQYPPPPFLPILTFFITFSFMVCEAIDCGGSNVGYTIVVDQFGLGNFKKIQDAINSIPSNNNRWIKIQINPGTYVEQVTIPHDKPCIFLQGQNRFTTTITYAAHSETDTSATFSSWPANVVVTGITFENSYNRALVQNCIKDGGSADSVSLPALAARIYGDKSAFYKCGFLGFQDTLWDALGRHYFSKCYIEGAVDFIFGSARSFYEHCTINATSPGFITAQGRESPQDPGGFVFKKGLITGTNGVKTLLGRAYGPYSRVVFRQTFFNDVVDPLGWNAWHYAGSEGNFTYAEVNCQGPGSNTADRVWWKKKLHRIEIRQYLKSTFINSDNWLGNIPM